MSNVISVCEQFYCGSKLSAPSEDPRREDAGKYGKSLLSFVGTAELSTKSGFICSSTSSGQEELFPHQRLVTSLLGTLAVLVRVQSSLVRVFIHLLAALGHLTSCHWAVCFSVSSLIFVQSLGLFILTGLFLIVKF